MDQIIEFISKQNWSAVLQGIGAIWVAIVATIALNQWKRQIKLQKQVDFVDLLTDEVHEFMLSASPVVSAIKYTKIGFTSFSGTNREYKDLKHNGAISFIEKHGKEESEKMIKEIDQLRKIISKIRSLSTKGQMYGINNYAQAKASIEIMEHVYRQMEAFAYFIGNTHLNWLHPDVQNTLDGIAEMDEELISKNLAQQNIEYIKFAQDMYKKI